MQKEKMNGRRTIEIGKPEELDYYTNEEMKIVGLIHQISYEV